MKTKGGDPPLQQSKCFFVGCIEICHVNLLTDIPGIILSRAAYIRKLSRQTLCCSHSFNIFRTIKRIHIKPFICSPHQSLLEIGTFQIFGDDSHPLFGGYGRKIREKFLSLFTHIYYYLLF